MSKIIEWIRNKVIGDDETIITKERKKELENKEALLKERMDATAQIIELPEEETTNVEDKPTTAIGTTQSTLLDSINAGIKKTKGRKVYKVIWEDSNKEGVIKEYTQEVSFYYHYDPKQSPKIIRGYSENYPSIIRAANQMVEFKYDHSRWKRVRIKYGLFANPPRNEDEFRRKPFSANRKHIYYDSRNDNWYIQKRDSDILREFGRYPSLDVAEKVLQYLVENDWPLELLQKAKESDMTIGNYFLGCVEDDEND